MSVFLPFILLAAAIADAPAEQPVTARVVAGSPLAEAKPLVAGGQPISVTVVGRAEAGDGEAPKAIQLRVVGGENFIVADDGAGDAVPAKQVPFIGVVTAPLTPAVRAQTDLGEDVGLSVESVAPESPAAKAGLEPFDILARYDDQILCAAVQLSALVKRTGTGNTATLTVIRRGKEMPIEVTVGEHAATATLALERLAVDFGRPDPASPAIVLGQPVDGATLARLREQLGQPGRATPQYGFGAIQPAPGPGFVPAVPAVPGVPVPPPVPGVQSNQRWVFVNPTAGSQTQSTSVFSDAQGQVILRETNGERTITILGPDGQVQFKASGDAAEVARVPEEYRGRVEQAIASAGPGVWSKPAAAPAPEPTEQR